MYKYPDTVFGYGLIRTRILIRDTAAVIKYYEIDLAALFVKITEMYWHYCSIKCCRMVPLGTIFPEKIGPKLIYLYLLIFMHNTTLFTYFSRLHYQHANIEVNKTWPQNHEIAPTPDIVFAGEQNFPADLPVRISRQGREAAKKLFFLLVRPLRPFFSLKIAENGL